MNIVLMPYAVILAQIAVFSHNKKNIINPKGAQLQGERKVAIGNSVDMTQIKDDLKKKKVGLNDYIVVCATLALS